MSAKLFSCVISCYNEEENILALLKQVKVNNLGKDVEFIIVNNGSTDKSWDVISKIKNGAKLFVPERIRWRDEKSFYLLNIRWANTIEVPVETANKLINFQNNKSYFDINDFGLGKEKELATLIYKDALVSNEIKIEIKNKGVSVDPSKLPAY